MLEQKMLTTAYPMLLRLMGEYGHSLITIRIDKSIMPSPSSPSEGMRFDIRSTGKIKMFISNYNSTQLDASIGANIKKCPVLNFLTSSSFVSKSNAYTRYCSEIVAEIEKYKELEKDAYAVIDRLDSFNIPLTRVILTEKILN